MEKEKDQLGLFSWKLRVLWRCVVIIIVKINDFFICQISLGGVGQQGGGRRGGGGGGGGVVHLSLPLRTSLSFFSIMKGSFCRKYSTTLLTAQYNIMHNSTVQYSAEQCRTVQSSTV